MKALLLENIHPEAVRLLEADGIEVATAAGALDEAELIAALDGVQLLGIRSKTQVTRKVLEAAPQLVAVGAFSIGVNQIDLAAAADASVAVFNAPYSNTRSVVELVIGEIIMLARHLGDHNASMHVGQWNKTAKGAHEVRGRTLGIVGYGNIGSQLSVLAEAVGMHVYFYDIVDKLALGNAVRCNSLEELLGKVETVSIHIDGRPENTNLFNAETFAMMRPRSLFLNLSRGKVVDIPALRDALESGHLAGAGLDVYPVEPKKSGEAFTSELQGLPNVILTPHIGGSTAEAQQDIGRFVAGKFRDYVRGGATAMSVNLPEIALEPLSAGVRLLHLHENVPGVLSAVNSVLGAHGVNIDRQQLATRDGLGYVVTDCQAVPEDAVAEIRALPATRRLTVLG